MKTALVDGDILAYMLGFATQESWYECGDGTVWSTLGQAKKQCEKIGQNTEEIVEYVEAEHKSHAFRLVKNLLLRVKERTGASELKVFLTGSTNYRTDLATIKPYKGNRTEKKPYHYDNIRQYLIDVLGAEVTVGIEADDAMGINQGKDTCICTIDKDLDMVEGYHYNFKTDKLYDVSKFAAMYNFYNQLLTGDPVDNIQGCPGIGKAKAAKILAGLHTEEDMYWAVLCTYTEKYERPMSALLENADLLWILREEDKLWQPPE